jgi:putative flippase GtrA
MPRTPSDLLALTRTAEGRKMFRYTMVSVIAVTINFCVLGILVGLFQWSALWGNITGTAVATIPSYELNRKWAWGKNGKSHLLKEVLPFWALGFAGLAFSTYSAVLAESFAKHHHMARFWHTAVVEAAVIGAFGVLWVGKFIIFNKVLFVHHPQDLEPSLDSRTGIPG